MSRVVNSAPFQLLKDRFLIRLLDKPVKVYYNKHRFAAVVKSADTKDLKSFGSNSVPVQVRSAAPLSKSRLLFVTVGFLHFSEKDKILFIKFYLGLYKSKRIVYNIKDDFKTFADVVQW